MVTKKVFYECGFCKRLYEDENQAVACESHHEALTELKVIDQIDVADEAGALFPGKLLLKHDKSDDQLGEYTLSRTCSVTDFYHTEEPWFQA